MKTITIFIADDHKLMLEGMASLIESIDGLKLLAKFSSGKTMLDALNSSNEKPAICLVDIDMPELDGIETTRQIKKNFSQVKVIALTMHHESHFVSKMIAAGANGYMLKNVDREAFIQTLQRVVKSDEFVTEGISQDKSTGDDRISAREKEILKLIVAGKTNKEIGEELFISDRTADTHRTNIKRKLKLSSLAQLIQYARDNGIS